MADHSSTNKRMFRISLNWANVPSDAGPQAAVDIARNFADRPWHQNVLCKWDAENSSITLEASNDFDENGRALIDEFSDEISACVRNAGDGDIRVVFVKEEE